MTASCINKNPQVGLSTSLHTKKHFSSWCGSDITYGNRIQRVHVLSYVQFRNQNFFGEPYLTFHPNHKLWFIPFYYCNSKSLFWREDFFCVYFKQNNNLCFATTAEITHFWATQEGRVWAWQTPSPTNSEWCPMPLLYNSSKSGNLIAYQSTFGGPVGVAKIFLWATRASGRLKSPSLNTHIFAL